MNVSISISPKYKIPFAVIHTESITDEIQNAIDILNADYSPVTAQHKNGIIILKPTEIYMVRIEGGETVIYGKNETYFSRKRLYEIFNQLGNKFMQISKSTIVNLEYLDSVETGFNGTLLLKLKNGSRDYVSRKFLPEFKKYLGL